MTPRLLRLAVGLAALLPLAACGGGTTKEPATTVQAATSATLSVLRSRPQQVTFAEVDAAVERLYRRRPAVRTFVARDVEYTRATRDKVLEICHHGGLEMNRAALESSRIAGCAPLIFFFYNFGRQKHAPDSIGVARKIYWYAVQNVHGPFDARGTLDALLRTWAVG
jgi:hypothetical protein